MGTGADTFPILIPSGQLESPALLWGTSPEGLLDLGAITFSEDEVPVSGLGARPVQLSLGQPCGQMPIMAWACAMSMYCLHLSLSNPPPPPQQPMTSSGFTILS